MDAYKIHCSKYNLDSILCDSVYVTSWRMKNHRCKTYICFLYGLGELKNHLLKGESGNFGGYENTLYLSCGDYVNVCVCQISQTQTRNLHTLRASYVTLNLI